MMAAEGLPCGVSIVLSWAIVRDPAVGGTVVRVCSRP